MSSESKCIGLSGLPASASNVYLDCRGEEIKGGERERGKREGREGGR